MNRQSNEDRIAEELSAIPGLMRGELIERWVTAYGRPPPSSLGRRLLEYSAAYQLQVKAFGGLKPKVHRKLRELAGSKVRPPRSKHAPRRSKALSSRTRLVREWHGETHTVEVVDKGFLYDGTTYSSLSKIANVITGTRWSGPRFFGL